MIDGQTKSISHEIKYEWTLKSSDQYHGAWLKKVEEDDSCGVMAVNNDHFGPAMFIAR